MTTKTETETLAEQKMGTLRAAFLVEHPRAVAATVHVEGDRWLIDTGPGSAVFVADFAGPLHATFTQVDRRDHDVALAAPFTVALPLVPPAPVAVTGFDPRAEIRRARHLLDRLRVTAEQCRVLLRGVAPTANEELERLRGLVPRAAVNVAGQVLAPDPLLDMLVRDAVGARQAVQGLRTLLTEAQALAVDVGPKLRTAHLEIATAQRGQGRLADLHSLGALGEVVQGRVSEHEALLDAADEALDVLGRAVAEAGPLCAKFEEAVRLHGRAVVRVAREIGTWSRRERLARLKRQAEAERALTPTEKLAEEAVAAGDLAGLPTMTWSPDPLEGPTLTT